MRLSKAIEEFPPVPIVNSFQRVEFWLLNVLARTLPWGLCVMRNAGSSVRVHETAQLPSLLSATSGANWMAVVSVLMRNSLPILLPSRSYRCMEMLLKKLMSWPPLAQAITMPPCPSIATAGSNWGFVVLVLARNVNWSVMPSSPRSLCSLFSALLRSIRVNLAPSGAALAT